jgi:hypothetical protein
MPRAYALPPIRCSAKSKRSHDRCKRWATPGAAVCKIHGSASPQAKRLSTVRLTMSELAATDPRPVHEVMRDAVAIADRVMRDLDAAVIHGDTSADTLSRLLESSRYASAIGKIARDAGVVDPPPVETVTRFEFAAEKIVPMLLDVVGDVIRALDVDPAHRVQLHQWAIEALSAGMAAIEAGVEPSVPSPPPAPVREAAPGSDRGQAVARAGGAVPAGDDAVIDAEVVEDDDPDRFLTDDEEREYAAMARTVLAVRRVG